MKYDLSGGVSRSAGRVFTAFRRALFNLLQRQSFESISVQALCNEADYPRSTFYNYFDDIYDLLDFCMQAPIFGFDTNKYTAMQPGERLHAIASDIYDILLRERSAFTRVFQYNKSGGVLQSAINRHLKQEVYSTIIKAVPVRDDLPREMLAEHCCNVIHLVFSWSILQGELVDKETAMGYGRKLLAGVLLQNAAEGGAS